MKHSSLFIFAIFFSSVCDAECCPPTCLTGWLKQQHRQQLDIWVRLCFSSKKRIHCSELRIHLTLKPHLLIEGFLTGCWLTWPSGRSSVGSCRPACVGGTRLPPSCPEPWPSSTCSRPRSWRCHCGNRSQPGCPLNTDWKKKKKGEVSR